MPLWQHWWCCWQAVVRNECITNRIIATLMAMSKGIMIAMTMTGITKYIHPFKKSGINKIVYAVFLCRHQQLICRWKINMHCVYLRFFSAILPLYVALSKKLFCINLSTFLYRNSNSPLCPWPNYTALYRRYAGGDTNLLLRQIILCNPGMAIGCWCFDICVPGGTFTIFQTG